MARPKVATLEELCAFAKAFSDWFHRLDEELLRSPLQARERAIIDAYLNEVADITEEVTRVIKHAQKWEPAQ